MTAWLLSATVAEVPPKKYTNTAPALASAAAIPEKDTLDKYLPETFNLNNFPILP